MSSTRALHQPCRVRPLHLFHRLGTRYIHPLLRPVYPLHASVNSVSLVPPASPVLSVTAWWVSPGMSTSYSSSVASGRSIATGSSVVYARYKRYARYYISFVGSIHNIRIIGVVRCFCSICLLLRWPYLLHVFHPFQMIGFRRSHELATSFLSAMSLLSDSSVTSVTPVSMATSVAYVYYLLLHRPCLIPGTSVSRFSRVFRRFRSFPRSISSAKPVCCIVGFVGYIRFISFIIIVSFSRYCT